MSQPSYRISEKAVEDLENIWLYTVNKWSNKQADRYYNLIIDEIEFTVSNYDSSRSAEHIRENYRMSKMKSHLIFFRKSVDDVIEVVRILHQSMDVENRLAE